MKTVDAKIDYTIQRGTWHIATIAGPIPEGVLGTPAGRAEYGTPALAFADLVDRVKRESGVQIVAINPPAHNLLPFQVVEAWEYITSNGDIDYFWSEFHPHTGSAGLIRMKFRTAGLHAKTLEALPEETQTELLRLAFPDAP